MVLSDNERIGWGRWKHVRGAIGMVAGKEQRSAVQCSAVQPGHASEEATATSDRTSSHLLVVSVSSHQH